MNRGGSIASLFSNQEGDSHICEIVTGWITTNSFCNDGSCSCGKAIYIHHNYIDGICTLCGHQCTHVNDRGEGESMIENGTCTLCGVTTCTHENVEYRYGYGSPSYTHEVICKDCGAIVSGYNGEVCDITIGQSTCSKCGFECTHYDNNNDGVCDTCGYGECDHSWNHVWDNSAMYTCQCQICGITQEVEGVSVDRKPTCTEPGIAGIQCELCGTWIFGGVEKPALGHNWNNQYTPYHECYNCGIQESHDFNNGVCDICGRVCPHHYTNGVCDICGHRASIECIHLNKTYTSLLGDWSHKVTCSDCGTVVIEYEKCMDNEANMICTPSGSEFTHSRVCKCGYELPSGSHEFANGVCTLCGYVSEGYVSECDHEWKYIGSYQHRCDKCGAIEDCDTHTIGGYQPSCDSTGQEWGCFCTKCDYSEGGEYIPATGHNYSFFNGTEATCTSDGYTTYECSVCGDRSTTVTPATGHRVNPATGECVDCDVYVGWS
jgi:hypothetical protein